MNWLNEPESREVIRQLNWFLEAGFRCNDIDLTHWYESISITGECLPDDIVLEVNTLVTAECSV